jgi:ATP-binding cassette subfamily B protein
MSQQPLAKRPEQSTLTEAAPAVASLVRIEPWRDREALQAPIDRGLLLRLYRFTAPHRKKRTILLVMVILRSLQLPVLSWGLGHVTTIVAKQAEMPASARHWAVVVWWSLGYLGWTALTELVLHFRSRYALEFGEAVVHDLRDAVFAYVMRMPMSFFHKTRLGRLISRVTSDIEVVRSLIQDVAYVGVVQLGQMLGSAAIMAIYDWKLFLVVVAIAPLLWVINRAFRSRLASANRAVQESFSRITATLAESVGGIRLTQAYERQDLNGEMFTNLLHDHTRYNMRVAWLQAIFVPLLEFNGQLFTALLLVVGGWRAFHGTIPLETLIVFFFLINLFLGPIQQLGSMYVLALQGMAGAERVFNLLDRAPEWQDAPTATALPPLAGRVRFEQVGFAYDRDRPVLHDIDIDVAPGQTVALVGHTGSGKSSIISLLAKFHLPTSGRVLIDGHDLAEVTGHSLHRQMGLVSQNNFLFSGTIAENIRVSKPEASEDEILEVLQRLDCLDLFESLPQGLATVVGERGSGISLGQRQLVCFARAMICDPRLLILDEATSAIDGITEARLQAALSRLLLGRTSFVVAHRLSTIRTADQVLVLERGRIVERGTHKQLLALGGAYADLHRQFVYGALDPREQDGGEIPRGTG